MIDCAKDFEWWIWEDNADQALKPTGGTLTIQQTAKRLRMSEDEVQDRIEARSILSVPIPDMHEDHILIPAFQFQGEYHPPGFHDLWDRLDPGCRVERICQFFVHEIFPATGERVIDVLRQNPCAEILQALDAQADAFKLWCTQSELDDRKTTYCAFDPCLESIKDNDPRSASKVLELQSLLQVEQKPPKGAREGLLALLRRLGLWVCSAILMVVCLALGGILFPWMLAHVVLNRFSIDLLGILFYMFIGSGVVFVLYIALLVSWWVGWL